MKNTCNVPFVSLLVKDACFQVRVNLFSLVLTFRSISLGTRMQDKLWAEFCLRFWSIPWHQECRGELAEVGVSIIWRSRRAPDQSTAEVSCFNQCWLNTRVFFTSKKMPISNLDQNDELLALVQTPVLDEDLLYLASFKLESASNAYDKNTYKQLKAKVVS